MPGPSKQFDPEKALAAATHVFWGRGYEAASLSELLTAMGISKKSLYDTFGNKRELFLSCLHYYDDNLKLEMSGILNADGSPLGNLRKLLDTWRNRIAQPNCSGCMLGTNIADFSTEDGEVAEILHQLVREIEKSFHKCLKAAQEAGELNSAAKPRDVARMLVCLTQGMALLSRVSDSPLLSSSSTTSLMALIARH